MFLFGVGEDLLGVLSGSLEFGDDLGLLGTCLLDFGLAICELLFEPVVLPVDGRQQV